MVSRATWLVALSFAAGCSFQPAGPESNVGIDAGDDVDDGGGGVDADDDIDDDGVPNASDNCPRLANPPPQRDHDADGVGDPCDPCPQRPLSEGSGDADGDGVGDVCDPRPGMRDRITLFDGFYDAPGDDWTFVGTWDHDPAGFVRHAGNSPMAAFAVLPRSFDAPYFIESSVVVDSLAMPMTAVSRQAGVAFAASEALDGFYLCSVRDDLSTTPAPARAFIARFGSIDQPAENSFTNLADDLAAGSTYRVRGSHTTTEQGCVGTLGTTTGSPVLANATIPGTHVALRTFGMGVRFDYVVVYQPAP